MSVNALANYLASLQQGEENHRTEIVYGEVMTIDPLSIRFGELNVTKPFLVPSKMYTPTEPGQKVMAIKTNGGQLYFVLHEKDFVVSDYFGLIEELEERLMPISGGVLENYREKLTTVSASGGSIDLSLGNVFVHTPSGNRTYSITNAVNSQAHSFTLIVNMGSIVRTLTFPASVKWQGGEIPDLSTASKTYVLTFLTVDGGTTWLGMFGGEF